MLNRPFIRKKKRGFAFWSLVTALILFLLRLVPGIGQHIALSPWIALLVGIVASLPGLFRWVRWHLLWKLRNRLFVTYALIGVTPVILFGLLAAFAAYVLFGQFANFAATSEIHSELVELAANTDALALHYSAGTVEQKPPRSDCGCAATATDRAAGSQEHHGHSRAGGGRLPGRKTAEARFAVRATPSRRCRRRRHGCTEVSMD